jgi:hypothetical protein
VLAGGKIAGGWNQIFLLFLDQFFYFVLSNCARDASSFRGRARL